MTILQALKTNKEVKELTSTEIDELAVIAKDNEEAMWFIKAYYAPRIEALRETSWHKMNNEAHFLNDMEGRVEYAVRKLNPAKGNFNKLITVLFKQGVAKYCGERGKIRKEMFAMYDSMADNSEEGDTAGYDIAQSMSTMPTNNEIHTTEHTAIHEADVTELKAIYCQKETDEIIVDIIVKNNEYGGLTHYEIARKLADLTGKSFHSARSMLRTFIKNRKQEVAF